MGISKKEALQAIEREREMICAASDAVWDHPETAFQEFKSTEILCELLDPDSIFRPVWPWKAGGGHPG